MSKIFNFFSGTDKKNSNKGISKEEYLQGQKMGFNYFFKLLWRSKGKLTGLNFIFILLNFPIILVLIGISGVFNNSVNAPTHDLYAQLYGIMQYQQDPLTSALNGIMGVSTYTDAVTKTTSAFMFSGLALIFTIGVTSLGFFYVLRNISRSDYTAVWFDFWGAIKKNYKQGFIFGIIDSIVCLLLVYDFSQYKANSSVFVYGMFFYIVIFLFFLYFIARVYAYTIIVTFNLPLKKVIRNSLSLALLGLKRNLMALLSSAAVIYLSFVIYIFLPTIGFTLPFLIVFSLIGFICSYCAYPVIREFMIKPYYEEHPEELEDDDSNVKEEPTFKDRG